MSLIVIPPRPSVEATQTEHNLYEAILQTKNKYDSKQNNNIPLGEMKKLIDADEKKLSDLKDRRVAIYTAYDAITPAMEKQIKITERDRVELLSEKDNHESDILKNARLYFAYAIQHFIGNGKETEVTNEAFSKRLRDYEIIKALKYHVDMLNNLYEQRIMAVDDMHLLDDPYLLAINDAMIDLNRIFIHTKEYFEHYFELRQSLDLIDKDIRLLETHIHTWSTKLHDLNTHTETYITMYENEINDLVNKLNELTAKRQSLAPEANKENNNGKKVATAEAEIKKSDSSSSTSSTTQPLLHSIGNKTLLNETKELIDNTISYFGLSKTDSNVATEKPLLHKSRIEALDLARPRNSTLLEETEQLIDNTIKHLDLPNTTTSLRK